LTAVMKTGSMSLKVIPVTMTCPGTPSSRKRMRTKGRSFCR
jgi:hypothetical protein